MPPFCRNLSLLCLLSASALAPGVQATTADWPRYGHDQALTGRSPVRGDIHVPHVARTYSLAGRELLVGLAPASGEHRLRLSADANTEPGPPGITPPSPQRASEAVRGAELSLEKTRSDWRVSLPEFQINACVVVEY